MAYPLKSENPLGPTIEEMFTIEAVFLLIICENNCEILNTDFKLLSII